ncbi:hypothetical protein [Pedobacter sp. D749]|uniref:hypothetical protein n=1 Tax=Pedobacter sp. D749 TaxID=2856523 RepID=UPI002106EB64|nr:hypothetical protein [Pedobacter sp. D749]
MNYKLEDLEVYNLSEVISDKIWDIVMGWDISLKIPSVNNYAEQQILLVQILQKDMGGIISKRTKNFVIIAAVRF